MTKPDPGEAAKPADAKPAEATPAEAKPADKPQAAPRKPPPERVMLTPPQAITRYRRGVVAAGVGGFILLMGTVFAMSFRDPARRIAAAPPADTAEPLSGLETRLPARYDDPAAAPAPGTGGLPPPEASAPAPGAPAAADGPAQTEPSPERQRARQDAEAARASGLFFGGGGGRALAAPPEPAAASERATLSQRPDPLDKAAFIEAAAARGPGAPILSRPPLSPWEVKAGAVIAAALITGVNSDLPGPVIAQVTEPVFDHRTGRQVLIPQGARLIGRYDSQVGYGQSRLLMVWTQLVFPSGRSVDLGAMVGLDAAGMSGLAGRVERHGGRLARAIGLSTLVSIGGAAAQNSAGRGDGRVVLQDAAGGVAAAASQTGRQLVERDLQRAPTLKIAPGQQVRVLIDRDLILPPEG